MSLKYRDSSGTETSIAGLQGYDIDLAPTSGSDKAVQSGGTFTSIQDVYKYNGVMGAKNLIPYPYIDSTKSTNGITFTNTEDGVVIANGTSTSGVSYNITYATEDTYIELDANKSYVISCNDDAISVDHYGLGIRLYSNGETPSSSTGTNINLTSVGNNYKFTGYTGCYIYYYIWSNVTVENLKVYPMLRYGSDTDSTYQPYAKTNKQLTDDMSEVQETIPKSQTYSVDADSFNVVGTSEGSAILHKAYGMTVQDGTASITAPVSITNAAANWKAVGKNLIPLVFDKSSGTIDDISYANNNNIIHLEGTSSKASGSTYVTLIAQSQAECLHLKKGNTYTLSATFSGTCNGSVQAYYIDDEFSSSWRILTTTTGNESKSISFTKTVDSYNGGVLVRVGAGVTVNMDITVMLSLSSDTTYEEYKYTDIITEIPLRALEVTSSDNYNLEYNGKYYVADTLDFDGNEYKVTRRVGSYTVDGTEPWESASENQTEKGWSFRLSSYANYTKHITTVNSNTKDLVTDYLPCKTLGFIPYYSTSTKEDFGSGCYRTVNNIWFSIGAADMSTLGISSLETFTNWLSSNNVTILYPVDEYTESITAYQVQELLKLKTYDTCTTITEKGSIPLWINIEYAKEHIPALSLSGNVGKTKSDMSVTWEANGILGAKNYLPYPYTQTTREHNGITYTDNGDGSITANGTATAESLFTFYQGGSALPLEIGRKYRVTGCPKNGSASTYRIQWSNNSWTSQWVDYGDGKIITLTDPSVDYLQYIRIDIQSGTVCDNLVFKPMLMIADDTDDTYQSYAKTNKELTQIAYDNVGAHNAAYRGKYLGSEVTTEQYKAISSGTFNDLYIGDYWIINGTTYRIAAFNYWLNTGDTQCTTNHVVLVPDSNMYTAAMNSSNDTTGGYYSSAMHTSNLATAQNTINTDFGSTHILSHKELFTNSVSNGAANGWGWYDSTVDIMNEIMVYGHNVWGSNTGYETGIDKTQLSLFVVRPELITTRSDWWLRSVMSASQFAFVGNTGNASSYNASSVLGVRPVFAIKA